MRTKFLNSFICSLLFILTVQSAAWAVTKDSEHQAEIDALQQKFEWWPTDAKPAPVKDNDRSGYWWWPTQPGNVGPLWGNRGYVYVNKIIFDYKSDELPPPQPQELRPSLVIKNIIKNVKVYFDYNKATIREDAADILSDAVKILNRNKQADILVTGNCDSRGSEVYNEKLGRKRAEAVRAFMIDNDIDEGRIRIISRGKLDAVGHVTDLEGMQKDRNAQFMIAEVEEVMMPYQGTSQGTPVSTSAPDASQISDEKIIEEKKETVESEVKVSTKSYTVKANDSLWKIAEKEMGGGHRWKYLYEFNKDKIKNPKKLRVGTKLIIPVE